MAPTSRTSTVRTVISLAREDKAWLDAKAEREGVSMTEVVRSAIRGLRRAEGSAVAEEFDSLLRRTRGRWRRGDGLSYQRRVRSEWGRAEKRT